MRVAVDENNNVVAFNYVSAKWEVEVEDNLIFSSEPTTTEQNVYKFYVKDGVVKRKTEKQILEDPMYIMFQKQMIRFDLGREADPLFFKYQRGEVDKQVWLDKVAEVKARYPYEE